MDSKVVSKELREIVRPVLRDVGFTKFTGRTAWRSTDTAKWVLNFQSFSVHIAAGVGCPTFSFSLRLGIYFDFVASSAGREVIADPQEWECTFRFAGLKGLEQPWFRPYGRLPAVDHDDVWFVKDDGSNLSEVVADVRSVVEGPGLATLGTYQDPLYAYSRAIRLRPTLASNGPRSPDRGHAQRGLRIPALARSGDGPRTSPRARSRGRSRVRASRGPTEQGSRSLTCRSPLAFRCRVPSTTPDCAGQCPADQVLLRLGT